MLSIVVELLRNGDIVAARRSMALLMIGFRMETREIYRRRV
jgi:hypothetical protein